MFRSRIAVALAITLSFPSAGHSGALTGAWVPTLADVAVSNADVFADGSAYAFSSIYTGLVDSPPLVAESTTWSSHDSGLTWQRATTPFHASVLDMTTAKVGFAFEIYDLNGGLHRAPRLFRTVDGAATWQRRSFPFPADAIANTVSLLRSSPDGRTVFASGTSIFRDDEGCTVQADGTPYYLSNDGGATWQASALAVDGRLVDVQFATASDGVVLLRDERRFMSYDATLGCHEFNDGYVTSLWVTHDGGRTFTKTFDCRNACSNFVGMSPSGRIFANTVRPNSNVGDKLMVSDDDGRTWRTTEFPAFGDIAFVDERIGYASMDGFWRTDDGGDTWRREPTLGVTSPVGVSGLLAVAGNGAALGFGFGSGGVLKRVP